MFSCHFIAEKQQSKRCRGAREGSKSDKWGHSAELHVKQADQLHDLLLYIRVIETCMPAQHKEILGDQIPKNPIP